MIPNYDERFYVVAFVSSSATMHFTAHVDAFQTRTMLFDYIDIVTFVVSVDE